MSITVDARLAVEVGAARVKAALAWPDGTIETIVFDGQPWLASEVFVTADGVLLVGAAAEQHAGLAPSGLVAPVPGLAGPAVQVGGREVEPHDLVAALARAVADQVTALAGGVPERVVAAVPATWGPRRIRALRDALSDGGLGRPEMVETAVAVGQYLLAAGATIAHGTGVLVCNIGESFEACLLRRTTGGFDIVTRMATRTAGGTAIDEAVATALGLTTAPDDGRSVGEDPAGPTTSGAGVGLRAARTAKEMLSYAVSVPVQPVGSGPARVFTVEELRAATGPVTAELAQVAQAAIDAADLPPGTPLWVVTAGGGARMPIVSRPLEGLGVPPWMVADPDLAVVHGALYAAPHPDRSVEPPARGVDPDTVGSWQDLATALGAAAAAIVLYAQFLAGSTRYGVQHNVLYPGGLLAHWGGLAAATTMAGLACVIGVFLATAGGHVASRDPRTRNKLMAAGLGGGGVVGLVVALVAGSAAAGGFDLPAGPFLRWAVLPVLPLTIAAACLAAIMLWRPDPPDGGWLAWLRFPGLVVPLVAVGELFIGYDLTDVPGLLDPVWRQLNLWAPNGSPQIISAIGRVGALTVGAGIGILLVRRWWLQLAIAPLLGVLLAATLTQASTGIIAAGCAAATAGWWLWRALYLILRPIILPHTATRPRPAQQPSDRHSGRFTTAGPHPPAGDNS